MRFARTIAATLAFFYDYADLGGSRREYERVKAASDNPDHWTDGTM